MDPYALIAQYPNAGQAFTDAFQKGQQQNALAAFATNPNDQTAGAAARYDPSAVLTYNLEAQKEKAALSQQQLQVWHKYAGELAKWADTPQKRDQAIDYLLSHNHPDISADDLLKLKAMPPDQWQAVRANFMALGGVQDDNPNGAQVVVTPQAGAPAFIYDKSTGQTKEIFAPNDGSQTPGAPVAPQTATNPKTGEKVQFNSQTGQWEPIGGQAGSPSPVPFR